MCFTCNLALSSFFWLMLTGIALICMISSHVLSSFDKFSENELEIVS